MTKLLFYGDPHGRWRSLFRAVDNERPDAVLILGDCDLDAPLAETVAPLTRVDIPVLWIHGNHDSDRAHWHDYLFDGNLPEGSLHGRVTDIDGVRVAGLGGIFRGEIWRPGEDGIRFRTREEFLRAIPAARRWRGGLPQRHRTTIFPEDYDKLARLQADILVTHEAPSCHRYGFGEIDSLAEIMGARLIVHGHHHEDYEGTLPSGVRVIGVGKATPRLEVLPAAWGRRSAPGNAAAAGAAPPSGRAQRLPSQSP